MASIFTQIIQGNIPSYKIAENDYCIAFLDIFPLKKGHTLVVPKIEVDKLFDLPRENYIQLMDFAYSVSKAIEESIDCKRVGMAVLGLEVPHAHIHLVPIDSEKDLNFSNDKLKISETEMVEIQKLIQQKM